MRYIFLFTIYLLISLSAFSQSTTIDSTATPLPTQVSNPAVLKFAVFPLVSGFFSNRLHLGIQHEKALTKHPKFTVAIGLLYSRTSTGVFGNGVQLWTSQHTIFVLRPGMRYYIRKLPQVYRGFFVSLAPYYTYGELYGQTEYRHGVGADAMVGYQRVFNRWTIEANYSVGVARTWYNIVEDPWNGPRKGIKNFVSPWAQINVGYLLW